MRVVGGRLKGRNLASPSSREIRPTADRLRESVFNILIHAYDDPIEGARVLDLFAGTGALGIEAVSRGAKFTLFVDNGAEARALLRNNVEALGLGGVTKVYRRDATDLGPSHPVETSSLAFLDPALRQGFCRESTRFAARWRLADAGCALGGGGGESRGVRRAGRLRGIGTSRLRRHRVHVSA
jgi:16S rRNA (guanine966-N2)-methyltransferase